MGEVFRVSQSGFYAWQKRRKSGPETKKTDVCKKSNEFTSNRDNCYSNPKITKMLQQKGIPISQKTVACWMKEEGIHSKTKKKHKPASSLPHQQPPHPNLLEQQFHAEKPNHKYEWRTLRTLDGRGVALSCRHHGFVFPQNGRMGHQ
jgi:putative transposase